MLTQAEDLLAETKSLASILTDLTDDQFETMTAFKGWTINDVLRHLHVWNRAAYLSYAQPDQFDAYMTQVMGITRSGRSMRDVELEHSKGLGGHALVRAWTDYATQMTAAFLTADPAQRVKWAGPDMSVRSSVSARLMETWAHGQELHDVLGVVRKNADRIHNIVVLGVNTYGWTFRNRKLDVPEPKPYIRLTAPSGVEWVFNEGASESSVHGTAEEFCQVVTQVRNVGDTLLQVEGPNARAWMAIAQCFAGPPNDPPPVGSRVTAKSRLSQQRES